MLELATRTTPILQFHGEDVAEMISKKAGTHEATFTDKFPERMDYISTASGPRKRLP